jgi:hypothetical protein
MVDDHFPDKQCCILGVIPNDLLLSRHESSTTGEPAPIKLVPSASSQTIGMVIFIIWNLVILVELLFSRLLWATWLVVSHVLFLIL